MPNTPDLPSLQLGTRLQDPLLVRGVETHQSDNGPFTVLTLGNGTGTIPTAPFWLADQPRVAGIATGDVVQVIGEVSSYRNRRQLSVSSVRVLPPDSVDWHDLLPSAGRPGPYWETIDRWLPEIEPRRLRGAVEAFFLNDHFRSRFGECPAAIAGPQATIGGLLKHTVEVAAVARTLGRVLGADPSLTLAGALLHDIGKLEAFEWESGFKLSAAGRRLGPAVMGTVMLQQRLCPEAAPLLTTAELHELQHMQLVAGDANDVQPNTLSAKTIELADGASVEGAAVSAGLEDTEAISLFGVSGER
jgi:putative nucleotidyltransferase with HDIG domain